TRSDRDWSSDVCSSDLAMHRNRSARQTTRFRPAFDSSWCTARLPQAWATVNESTIQLTPDSAAAESVSVTGLPYHQLRLYDDIFRGVRHLRLDQRKGELGRTPPERSGILIDTAQRNPERACVTNVSRSDDTHVFGDSEPGFQYGFHCPHRNRIIVAEDSVRLVA